MIQYRNVDNWKLINYQGHDIKEVHSSLGKVWPTIPPTPKFYAEYSDSTTYSAECDGDTTLTTATTRPSGYQYSAMTSAIIGGCITSIGNYAFQEYTSLSSITIPNSVISINNGAFGYCNGLTRLNSNTNGVFNLPSGVTSIGHGAFHSCTNLSSIDIPSSVTSIGASVFSYCESLTSVTIPSGVTSIGQEAFSSCDRLQSITVDAIVPPALGFAALMGTNNCPIYVPCHSVDAYKAASVWSNYASRITCIQPPTPTFDGKWLATYTGRTSSAECDATSSITDNEITVLDLVDVQIGSCVTTIGDMAFDYAYDLTSVTIPNSVTTIGKQAFQYCDGIPSITIPNSVTSIGIYAFNGCYALTSITLSSSITSIADSTFAYCSGLTSITIPDSVTSIGDDAFNRCSGLTNVTFGSGLTNLGNSTFENCLSLTSILIPSGVTNIGANSFYNCSGLTSITIESTTPPTLGSGAFSGTNDCPIYVPAQSVEAYKTSWSEYDSRIQAIS